MKWTVSKHIQEKITMLSMTIDMAMIIFEQLRSNHNIVALIRRKLERREIAEVPIESIHDKYLECLHKTGLHYYFFPSYGVIPFAWSPNMWFVNFLSENNIEIYEQILR
jgi:hypothetical protein